MLLFTQVIIILCVLADGDEVTIFDSADVSFAIQTCNRQLKLVLYGMMLDEDAVFRLFKLHVRLYIMLLKFRSLLAEAVF